MLSQVVERSGESTSVTMRAGAEIEAVPGRLQLRGGTYMEPTRFRDSSPRAHATTGFEVRSSTGPCSASSRTTTRFASAARSTCRASTSAGASASAAGTDRADHLIGTIMHRMDPPTKPESRDDDAAPCALTTRPSRRAGMHVEEFSVSASVFASASPLQQASDHEPHLDGSPRRAPLSSAPRSTRAPRRTRPGAARAPRRTASSRSTSRRCTRRTTVSTSSRSPRS